VEFSSRIYGTNQGYSVCSHGEHASVDDGAAGNSARVHLAAIFRRRALLIEQIEKSKGTIFRSRELLKRIDELLAKMQEEI